MEGWIKLHRKLLDNPLAKKANYLAVWVYLLLNANHADNDIIINNQRTTIRRGQLLTSIAKIADYFGMSKSTVSYILDYFVFERMIERSSTANYTIISIQNYDRYQEVEREVVHEENTRRTLGERNNNDKNDKNERMEEEEVAAPPKKVNRICLSRSQMIALQREFPGLSTSEVKEQVEKCNNYMAISSRDYSNPGLFFRGWLKRYVAEKKKQEAAEQRARETLAALPDISEGEARKNLERIARLKQELKIKGVID